ncbi:protein translocase subunit SecD [Comamonas serinivorans]|uniref:Protein translocase subunit SecD n=1 Tax=Comamonas serinivorans TaxID=1082851 RepID=A0A1Y0ERW5_9BURK|nr:protein translocase subunit SecD [Comamonas serinivorans]ARU06397.1 protein translocase subunit SecD [Comamonas serinivorans]
MNRYPLWKYVLIALVVLVSIIYTLPNFYGEAPSVQVSPGKATAKVTEVVQTQVVDGLKAANIANEGVQFDGTSLRVRLGSEDTQAKAKDVIDRTLNPSAEDPSYTVAMTLLSRSPDWLTKLNARPMYLGLDLRGGVHFMMRVDMAAAMDKRIDTYVDDLRSVFRDKKIQHSGVTRSAEQIEVRVSGDDVRDAVTRAVRDQMPDLQVVNGAGGADRVVFSFKPEALRQMQDQALKQNITTLHNRINELGVAEPVIQQQGLDRIVVQLPGMQDPAQAKRIIGRTATLEMRLVDESTEGHAAEMGNGPVPFGSEAFLDRDGRRVILKKQVLLTGENLTDAQAGIDSRNQQPKVDLTVDAKGGQVMKETSRRNLNKRMAIVLFEKGKGEVLTAPSINDELGNRFQISGSMGIAEANDLALLLRAGSLAAPMEIIEERTIGPSLGKENISKGFHSVLWGFVGIAVFMILYYHLFGVFSAIALTVNLVMLTALLSMLQATLTLPGIAAIALTLGMAIDANVLINERVREELRGGASPQMAIHLGYDRAWATIMDSNVTSLIAGIALLAFGSGPVRGFAVVHCLGILTSMFSAVVVSRGLVNFWYGGKKKLKTVSIGTVWRPGTSGSSTSVTTAD